mmetsp:Transcript_115313/g.333122  ORF Transcript_115313/g.333122 Transcript_115313/m.333122 type:complete len:389 (+) Transcript_115313:239-1405(+)
MRALLHHEPRVHDHDLVRPHHRGEPVRDEHHAASASHCADQFFEGLLHLPLVLGVERGRGLVEKQDRGLAEQRPRDGEPLLLPAAKPHPALADHRAIAFVQVSDELVGVRGARRRDDLLVGHQVVLKAIREVLADWAAEDLRLLLHDAHPLLVAPQVVVGERPVVDEDDAGLGVVKSEQQAHERALAGAASADHRDRAAAGDGEVQAFKHFLVGTHLVGEAHVAELHAAPLARQQGDRPRVQRDVRLEVHDLEDALGGGGRSDQRVQDPVEAGNGIVQHGPVQVELDQLSDAQLGTLAFGYVEHSHSAISQDQDDRCKLEVLGDGGDAGGGVGVLQAALQGLVRVLLESSHLHVVRAEGTHSADVPQGLRRHRVRVSHVHSDPQVDAL